MKSVPVRVSLPASVAADIGSLKKALGGILDKLGCQACCSGYDIFLQLQRNITLRQGLGARAEMAVGLASPEAAVASKTVRVGVSPKMADNIKEVYVAIDRIAELSGHPACATGCDMFLQLERNFMLDAKLEISELAMAYAQS